MTFQYWAQRGEPERTRFIALENAYHGDTLGAVSVGGIAAFHAIYGSLLFDVFRARSGDAGHLAELLDQHGPQIAGVVIEPLVQAAAGMLIQPDGYLTAVRELCDRHGVLLIVDEVATGFGRTGTMFACQHEQITPDLLCLGKGLTGGYLPLAATLTNERLYEGFLGEASQTFYHGHTFTGNPLGCAAGIATLQTFDDEQTLAGLGPKIEALRSALASQVSTLPAVSEIRQRGLMVGIELTTGGAGQRLGRTVTLAARRRGAIIRELGDVVVLMPAPAITKDELLRLVSIIAASIGEIGELGRGEISRS
jgi:adenosylmethionine-8-amino-7-oxononanoate aminotransferase